MIRGGRREAEVILQPGRQSAIFIRTPGMFSHIPEQVYEIRGLPCLEDNIEGIFLPFAAYKFLNYSRFLSYLPQGLHGMPAL